MDPHELDLTSHNERFGEDSARVDDRGAWEELRLQWLGRKDGVVRKLMSRLKDIPPQHKREFGRQVNELKVRVEARLAELDESLANREREEAKQSAAVDVTLPGREPKLGSIHPVNLVIAEIVQIFSQRLPLAPHRPDRAARRRDCRRL